MDRRGFLQSLFAAGAAITLAEREPVRVYSFAAPWVAEQAAFERALRVSAAGGPSVGGQWVLRRPVPVPNRARIDNANIRFEESGILDCQGQVSISNCFFSVKNWQRDIVSRENPRMRW